MPSRTQETRPSDGFPASSFKYTPLQHVRVLLTSFIQGLFAAAPPGCYRWNPEDHLSEIVVRDENPLHVETVGQRPAVNLTMGAIQFYSLGIDDLYTFDFSIGRKVKVVLIPGTVSINCSSRNDIESHNLSWVIAEHIWLLREFLLKSGFFEIGRGIQVAPPTSPGSIIAGDSGDEWYTSVISVPFQFNRKSAFTPLGDDIANNIKLSLRANTPLVGNGRGGPAQAGHEFPVRVTECLPESFAPNATDARGRTPNASGHSTPDLPLAPHPLNPSKLVYVETIRPHRVGAVRSFSRGLVLPIVRPCGGES